MRVLVTRPQPGTARTAGRLAELGYAPVQLPLTETIALHAALPLEALSADAVLLTSANALLHANDGVSRALAGKPCFAVGHRTAEMARKRGFATVTEGPGDAEGLADMVIASTDPGMTVAYLCGRVRRDLLEQALRASGRTTIPVEIYDTRAISYTPRETMESIGTEPIDAVLLYSAHAATLLSARRGMGAIDDVLRSAIWVCISQKTAEQLAGIPPERIVIAAEPHEEALFEGLAAAANHAAC